MDNENENIYDEIFSSHTKQCSTCRVILPLSEFYKDKSKPDGYKSVCILCCLSQKRLRYHKKKKLRKRVNQINFYENTYKYPLKGKCYKLNDETIVQIRNVKQGKHPLWILDVKPIIPQSDVTQYTITLWMFRHTWVRCTNPFVKGHFSEDESIE